MRTYDEEDIKTIARQMHALRMKRLPNQQKLRETYVLSEQFYARMRPLLKQMERRVCQNARVWDICGGSRSPGYFLILSEGSCGCGKACDGMDGSIRENPIQRGDGCQPDSAIYAWICAGWV